MRRFKVSIARYGPYKFGDVIPESVPRDAGTDPDELVARGIVVETTDRPNCAIRPVELVPRSDGSAELLAERNELRERAERAELDLKLALSRGADLEQKLTARGRLLDAVHADNAVLVADAEQLRRELDAARGRIAALEEESTPERETKPAALAAT